jgi:hypothetical protein
LKTCIRFTLQADEIDALDDQIISWVQEYERRVSYPFNIYYPT